MISPTGPRSGKIVMGTTLVLLSAVIGIFVVNNSLAASANCTYGTYGYGYTTWGGGSFGDCVSRLQNRLNVFYDQTLQGKSLAQDNSFGPATTAEVKKFQAYSGRGVGYINPDGIVGNQTWGKLCRYLAYDDGGLFDDIGCFKYGL